MRAKLICWLALVAPLVWLFGRVLVEQRVLNFRDVAHFYRPLWQWTSNEWRAGRIPLWNALDGLGMPAHADPAASLFYPGQLLFALPLGFTTCLNLYVVLHLLLAAVLLYFAARGLGASQIGATVGALSYALSGPVLFQYCNPIFLVSAAWLPLAVLAMHHMLQVRSLRWAIVLAITLALMTLGGDPQMAYHTLLIATLYAWMLWRSERRTDFPIRPAGTVASRENTSSLPAIGQGRIGKSVLRWICKSRLVLLGLSAVVALLLSAIQVLPARQWSASSARAAFDKPRNVFEVGQYLYQVQSGERTPALATWRDVEIGLFGAPHADSHHEHVYEFSVAPWRWLEFIWPNVGGTMFPIHRRWMSAVPAESRIWTPTLYLGLLPLLAGLTAFTLRRQANVTTRWLAWLTLLGILGSLGAYGLGWLLHELSGGAAATKGIGAPVGGLYWFFVVLLPGYVQFRYPAKLLVLAVLGISLLAARHWETFSGDTQPLTKRLLTVVIGTSVVSLLLLTLCYGMFHRWLGTCPPEFPFGPLDVSGTLNVVRFAFIHALVLALASYVVITLQRTRRLAPLLLLLLTMVDLVVANGWIVASSAADTLASTKASAALALPNGEVAVRFLRSSKPEQIDFINALPSSASRLDELLQWERAALAERWYLAENLNMVDAVTSIEPLAMQAANTVAHNEVAQAILAIDGVKLLPANFGDAIHPDKTPNNAARHPRPRAYLPKRLAVLASLTTATPASVAQRTQEVLVTSQPGATMDQSLATIEDAELAGQMSKRTTEFDTTNATCRITRYEHDVVEVAVDTPGKTLLVLADYYSPDWIAEVIDTTTGTSERTPIYRTNRVLRGVFVPAGKHQVIFRYRPTLFYVGLVISSAAWLVLTIGGVGFVMWRGRSSQPTP